jgi:hypothetical protein
MACFVIAACSITIIEGTGMRFHRMTIALAFLAASCAPVLAADNVDTLRTALSHIPEGALATADPMPIVYLDVKALSKAESGALSESGLRRLSLARLIRPLETLSHGMGKTWTEKAGVAFEDISYFAAFGRPPARVSYWGLADARAADALLDTLTTHGFKDIGAAPRMLANGEPRMISLTTRDPENPWLGVVGQSSFVFARQDTIVQASAPEDLKPIVALKRSVADNLAVAIVVEGVAGATATKDASVVQAMIITPLFGLETVDPSDLLFAERADLTAATEQIEARMEAGRKGIPAYLSGLVADVERKDGPAVVVSLAYADCAAANVAVSTIQTRWNMDMDLSRRIPVTGQAVATENGACAAVVSFALHADMDQPLRDAFRRDGERGFNFLQIGSPE